ncbi:hypothetical protein JTB14_007401 [Gonioctena quinquepunctata]|nr:hypothetical protein JTB14_007401 [Gonioctena quinquepunctata]
MEFYRYYLLVAALVISLSSTSVAGAEKTKKLSRRRRFLAFPEGSTFVATLCATYETVTGFSIYYQGVNWGAAFTLPNRSSVEDYAVKHKKRRRERRDMYSGIQSTLDQMGLDGRACVYRALCEAPRRFKFKSSKMSEELLRIIFKFPLQQISYDEPDDHHLYHRASRNGKQLEQQECKDMYPECSISLIDLALGDYSNNDNT